MELERSPIATNDLVATLRRAGCVFAEDEAALLSQAAKTPDDLAGFVERRVSGEPLEYILGWVEFLGDRWDVRPGVFIPRQRSEFLVEQATRFKPSLVLDLCCGCGVLGRLVRRRTAAALVGVDIAPEALACARQNGVRETYQGDLFDALPDKYHGRFSVILANAPYVPTAAIADMPRESRDHEPLCAVDGGPDGMDIQRRILREADRWLQPNGRLLTETSAEQGTKLAAFAAGLGWDTELVHDRDRGAHVLVVHRPVLHRSKNECRDSRAPSPSVDASKGEDVALAEEDIERRLDQNKNDVDDAYAILDRIELTLESHTGRLDAIDGRLDAMDGRLDAMDGRLDAIEKELTSIKSTLVGLSTAVTQLTAAVGRLG